MQEDQPPAEPGSTGDMSRESHGFSVVAPASAAGQRLDSLVAGMFPDYSRSRLQQWITSGFLTVNGETRRSKDKLIGGEQLKLALPEDQLDDLASNGPIDDAVNIRAEAVPLDIIHSDPHFYVINKPAGLVMHPAPGNRSGTLMNGLLHFDPALRGIPRAGIVHRLDKDTSGVCVVARTLKAHLSFVQQLQSRKMGRQYLAIVGGQPQDEGEVEEPIARHPVDRKRMAVRPAGKHALTYYSVESRFEGGAVLSVVLATGRTHQIRVHMNHIGHPLLGDHVYKKKGPLIKINAWLQSDMPQWNRQALHARHLQLLHPESGELCSFEQAPPDDMQQLIDNLPPLNTGEYE